MKETGSAFDHFRHTVAEADGAKKRKEIKLRLDQEDITRLWIMRDYINLAATDRTARRGGPGITLGEIVEYALRDFWTQIESGTREERAAMIDELIRRNPLLERRRKSWPSEVE